jgi:hypothetical protein
MTVLEDSPSQKMSVLKEYLNLRIATLICLLVPCLLGIFHMKQLTINIKADIDRDSSNMDTFTITATHHGDPETCTIPLEVKDGDIEAEGDETYWLYFCSLCSYYCNSLSLGEWIFDSNM